VDEREDEREGELGADFSSIALSRIFRGSEFCKTGESGQNVTLKLYPQPLCQTWLQEH
jgi:hypothetical protein